MKNLADIKLPVGRPWFRTGANKYLFPIFWPLNWRGWLSLFLFIAWLLGCVAVFIHLGWQLSDLLFYGWLLPTMAIWCLIVGVKSDVVQPFRQFDDE